MPTLTDSRMARRWTLCALYCAQGMPWGFVTTALLAYLAERGADLDAAAKVTSLALLPWSFKVVWGLVIDRFTFRPMGRRRPWVMLAQLAMGVTLLVMILDEETSVDIETFAWMVFLHNCFVSLQDVAADALAVDVLTDDERGRVNGMMWGANYLGVSIGGAGMGVVLARFGVQAAFVVQASVLFAIACFPIFFLEREGERRFPWSPGSAVRVRGERATESVRDLVRNLLGAFRTRAPVIGLVFAFSAQVMTGMFTTLNPIFYPHELGWTQEQFSWVNGGLGSGAGVAGALVGGFLVDRVGVRRIITFTAVFVAASCFAAGTTPLLEQGFGVAAGWLLVVEFLLSAQTVASFSMFMGLCTLAVAGTQFTLYMAATNFTRSQAAHLVSWLGAESYPPVFVGMGIAVLCTLPILYLIPLRRRSTSESGGRLFGSERLDVRRLRPDDVERLFAVYSDADAMRYVGDGRPITRDECDRWLEVTERNYTDRGYGLSVIELAETGDVIGFVGLVHPDGQEDVEIKYALAREHWGRGFATEAARAMLDWGRTTFGMERVIATTSPENLASHRVLEKSGLVFAHDREEDGEVVRTFVWEADGA